MIRIGMIGRASRDKSYLIMYLGKLLSQGMDICVVTKDQWFMPEVSSYEYRDRMTITASMTEMMDVDLTILDIAEPEAVGLDVAICISDIDRTSTEAGDKLFGSYADTSERLYLFINMIFDSKISKKYLCSRFGIDQRSEKVMCLYLDDGDMAVHVENGYNDRLDMRGLSKVYKRMLLTLAAYSQQDPKTLKRWLRMAERSK